MPVYEYVCTKCKHVFEDLLPYEAKPKCPVCGKATAKQMSGGNKAVFIHRPGNFAIRRRHSIVPKSNGKK